MILIIILFVLPTIIGMLFSGKSKQHTDWPFLWVSGQILLWAGFLAISIPMILRGKSFSGVVRFFGIYTGILVCSAVLFMVVRWIWQKQKQGILRAADMQAPDTQAVDSWTPDNEKRGWRYLLWGIFAVLLIAQLVLTVVMAYEEGDDAYYIATSTITEKSDTMYYILPYTGLSTGLDARHGLAPFPIWVAYLARISGIHAATVAHIILPITLIMMGYAIYYLIAKQLFREDKRKIPFFMVLTELLVLFGGYSVYTAENFLLVRASQGKAVIGNIIIPFLFYLMMLLLNKMQEKEKAGWGHWSLILFTMTAGCLCSTLGTILTCMFLAVFGLCAAVSYRNGKILFPLALCCVVPVGMALLYFTVG